VRRRHLDPERVVVIEGLKCANGTRTLVDLAATLSDLRWEQALESALRKRLTSISELEHLLPESSRARTPGTPRIRRVLALRPPGAPATESLLETLMVQLARTVRDVPDPARQWRVEDAHGIFVARVDLAWPDLGLFVELDGEHHRGQPVYDANRETAVVASTGWLCGRFTWTEVVNHAVSTARRLAAVAAQARHRPLARS
jgi:very-short-patch-repair endonuclease